MNGDKRKFLFVSITGLISDIAWQVAKEGHEVRYFIDDAKGARHRRWFRAEGATTGSARWTGPT